MLLSVTSRWWYRTQLSPALPLRLCCLLNLHRIIDNEIHELVESLFLVSLPSFLCGSSSSPSDVSSLILSRNLHSRIGKGKVVHAYSNLPLNPNSQLLVQPNLDG